MNRNRLFAIIKKEFIHVRRDKASLIIILVLPVMMLLLFGYAVTTDVENIAMAVVDQDHQQDSRRLVENFAQTGYFNIQYWCQGEDEVRSLIDSGKAKAGLIIPEGYSRDLSRGEAAQAQFLVDGSDPTVARTALSTAQLLAQVKTLELKTQLLEQAGMGGLQGVLGSAVDLRTRVWYNPSMESFRFNIPGLIGLIMQNITIMLTAFALVREREKGTMEQLIVTPVKPMELILGKLVPYVVIAFVDVILVLLLGTFVFGVHISGSVALLLAIAFLFLLFALGFGLFISTVAKTQLQAMQMTFGFLLPSILLSGFMFPREAMPTVIQWIGAFIPLTYFLQVLRGIILKGIGIEYLLPQVLALGGFGVAILTIAALRFQKKLE